MDEFIGIVKIFGGNFAPQGWMICDGTLLQIAEYQALYNLLGTTYGGDGQNTFGLPDLRSRIPVGVSNNGSPIGNTILGQTGGEESHTLTNAEMAAHSHPAMACNGPASDAAPVDPFYSLAVAGTDASGSFVSANAYNMVAPDTTLNGASVSFYGGSQPHENRQPYLAVNYVICVEGLYPMPN